MEHPCFGETLPTTPNVVQLDLREIYLAARAYRAADGWQAVFFPVAVAQASERTFVDADSAAPEELAAVQGGVICGAAGCEIDLTAHNNARQVAYANH